MQNFVNFTRILTEKFEHTALTHEDRDSINKLWIYGFSLGITIENKLLPGKMVFWNFDVRPLLKWRYMRHSSVVLLYFSAGCMCMCCSCIWIDAWRYVVDQIIETDRSGQRLAKWYTHSSFDLVAPYGEYKYTIISG